jgi:antitoxin Phd
MRIAWQLQEAKNKLSEVVEQASKNGPQEITRHGKKTAVILSIRDYRRLKRRKGTLADFFRQSPLSGLDLSRRRDKSREVAL